MNVIVAVNSDWGIGFGGRQVVVLSEDRKFFKEMTTGGVVIAGRKTFEEFPGGALPNRKNIILTRDKSFIAEGITVLHSVDEVLAEVSKEDSDKVFVAGGGAIYEQFLTYCSTAYITKLEAAPQSDTYFPNLDELENWSKERELESGESNGVKYTVCIYKNTSQLERGKHHA